MCRICGTLAATLALALVALAAEPTIAKSKAPPHQRKFELTYETTIAGLKPGQKARIWIPVPQSDGDQHVMIVFRDVPVSGRFETEKFYGNRLFYAEADGTKTDRVRVRLAYLVTRRELKGETPRDMEEKAEVLSRLLKADAMVPVTGKPLELIKDRRLPRNSLATAKVLYDVVNDHMRYSKEGAGWGRGDAVWACDSKHGNCTDFHSLFIALARSQKIPAKFEIGFMLPAKRGTGAIAGYHCWAKFKPDGKGWVPVDISEANKDPKRKDYYFGNLTEDRVTFSTGRDLTLSPKQDGPPINFLIYPYVEVDGKVYPKEKIVSKFSFKDE